MQKHLGREGEKGLEFVEKVVKMEGEKMNGKRARDERRIKQIDTRKQQMRED